MFYGLRHLRSSRDDDETSGKPATNDSKRKRMDVIYFTVEILEATIIAITNDQLPAKPNMFDEYWERAERVSAQFESNGERNLVSLQWFKKRFSNHLQVPFSDTRITQHVLLIWRFPQHRQKFQTTHQVMDIKGIRTLNFNRNRPPFSPDQTSIFETELSAYGRGRTTDNRAMIAVVLWIHWIRSTLKVRRYGERQPRAKGPVKHMDVLYNCIEEDVIPLGDLTRREWLRAAPVLSGTEVSRYDPCLSELDKEYLVNDKARESSSIILLKTVLEELYLHDGNRSQLAWSSLEDSGLRTTIRERMLYSTMNSPNQLRVTNKSSSGRFSRYLTCHNLPHTLRRREKEIRQPCHSGVQGITDTSSNQVDFHGPDNGQPTSAPPIEIPQEGGVSLETHQTRKVDHRTSFNTYKEPPHCHNDSNAPIRSTFLDQNLYGSERSATPTSQTESNVGNIWRDSFITGVMTLPSSVENPHTTPHPSEAPPYRLQPNPAQLPSEARDEQDRLSLNTILSSNSSEMPFPDDFWTWSPEKKRHFHVRRKSNGQEETIWYPERFA
ncbi:hypothetical protein M426DRAFT_259613 [Hypoxylon sp. CI-4A]|nr:hypothetical protein M426DRAFT_259613 [Hypoxylon sp. CI-4A]